MKLICKLDPKNSGITYETTGKSEKINVGFNDFIEAYTAKRVFPKKWDMEDQELIIPVSDIGGIYTRI